MSKISPDSVYLAQQRAIATYTRGLQLIDLGKSLSQDKHFYLQKCGQFIEQQGWLVQQYARESLVWAEEISTSGFCSTYYYTEAVFARSKAVKLYTQAVTMYTEAMQEKYTATLIRLELVDMPKLC